MIRLTLCAALIAGPVLAEGTGANYQPVIDGPTGPNYSSDLAACQTLAREQNFSQQNAETIATDAGAAALAKAITDNHGKKVRDAAEVGAIAGAAHDLERDQRERENIVKHCMRERGYKVVG